ncbi:unnamed protein product [Coffea canephora]|uniref:EGF-like domain-containing protein n=1 Tax=Coffea canephora TaxID=49390 RepID=A0A068UUV4_COFCA|nr:unnamed protein product [Coffea canephora]
MLSNALSRTVLSVSVESCPNHCSDHGTCKSNKKTEGPSPYGYFYYFCKCNGRYGGFDCSTELVTQSGYIWHVIFLTASNAAALFPEAWALRQKALADWVVFTCCGVASAVYHACDVGSWCALPFQVLQFMDSWLSFMAVVSTFIYLTFINEGLRRTTHTISSISNIFLPSPSKIIPSELCRSRNIPLVLAIGALGLLFAWLMKLFSAFKSNSLRSNWNFQHRLLRLRSWLPDLKKALNKRFKWRFVLAGFIAMSIAALSWDMESLETSWIWHSAWHVSIYTSAFFFLCSRSTVLDGGGSEAVEDDARSLTVQ